MVKWSVRCRHRVPTGVMPGRPASTVHGPFTRSSPHGGRLVHLSGDRRYAVLSPRFRGPPRPLPKVVVGPRRTRAHGRAVAAAVRRAPAGRHAGSREQPPRPGAPAGLPALDAPVEARGRARGHRPRPRPAGRPAAAAGGAGGVSRPSITAPSPAGTPARRP